MTPSTQDARATGLVELALRCEQATGGDRELLRAVAVATGWCLHPSDRQRDDSAQSDTGYTCLDCGADSWGNTGPTGQKRSAPIPEYLTSLDSAMTLVPEGQETQVLHKAWRTVAEGHALHIRLWKAAVDGDYAQVLARHVAAAALRALAASTKDQNDDG